MEVYNSPRNRQTNAISSELILWIQAGKRLKYFVFTSWANTYTIVPNREHPFLFVFFKINNNKGFVGSIEFYAIGH